LGAFSFNATFKFGKNTAAHKDVHVFIGWTGESHLGGGRDRLHNFVEIRIRIFYGHIEVTAIVLVPTAVMGVAFKSTGSVGCPVGKNRDVAMHSRHESLGYRDSAPEIGKQVS
jgi:hypothetical protein